MSGQPRTRSKMRALKQARELMPPIDLSPMEAILWCVKIMAGEVAYYSARIAELEMDDLVVTPVVTRTRPAKGEKGSDTPSIRVHERTTGPLELNLWIRERDRALDRLANYSKMAIDAGVAERQVALAENYGRELGVLLRGILEDLALDSEQERSAPAIVKRHLMLLEKGESEHTEQVSVS